MIRFAAVLRCCAPFYPRSVHSLTGASVISTFSVRIETPAIVFQFCLLAYKHSACSSLWLWDGGYIQRRTCMNVWFFINITRWKQNILN